MSEICSACGGDGIETCNNPDHGFINAFGGEVERLGCPGCGHHPEHKMSGPCPECNGTGKVKEPQQPSKTPRIDKWISLHHSTDTQPFLDFARQLETELSTANAEVERLKEHYKTAMALFEISEEKVTALLENSKALAHACKSSEAEIDLALAAHNKLMEQIEK